MSRSKVLLLVAAFVAASLPSVVFAQTGSIAGTARDASGAALPGVTVEVTSPALIEKVRSTTTDGNGQYQITTLPIGTYTVTFKLQSFASVERSNVVLSSNFTAPVNADMKVGDVKEVVSVIAEAPLVDVRNASQRVVFGGADVRGMPTTGNLAELVNLVPGIQLTAVIPGNSVPNICSGGAGDGSTGIGASTSQSGGASGCSPVLTGFNAHASMNDAESMNQGRIQVDGLGVQTVLGGGRAGYLPDLRNAQEITFTLSGSLGESETGGTTINIIPRTGGNRYSGTFYTSYAEGRFYGDNGATRTDTFRNLLDHDHDVNASFGGPIVRDRLWFYLNARHQGRTSLLQDAFYNRNEGVFGANYAADENRAVRTTDTYRSANVRLTIQATQKDKFNIFWDEQHTCEYPCRGTTGRGTSPEASSSQLSFPVHVAQLSWTNPLTSRFLLEAAGSAYQYHRDQTKSLGMTAYSGIPRITETGTTTGTFPGGGTVTSGSINRANYENNDNIQARGSVSYISGSHNVKLGYQGAYYSQDSRPSFNDLRLAYNYTTPAATCTAGPAPPGTGTWCGLNLANPNDPFNTLRAPVPTSVTQYIPQDRRERVWFNGFYVQDQWTWNRLTLNGALRYDHAQSKFLETCVGPDVWMSRQWCVNQGGAKGVDYQDFTPRWGVAWDVFGNGKTSIKWNMGRYLNAAGVSGNYTATNVAGRTIDTYQRAWTDVNGNRMVDCDLGVPLVAPNSNSFPSNGECGAVITGAGTTNNTARRFGRSPGELDEDNVPIGLGTTQCGREDSPVARIPQAVQDYCNAYLAAGGQSLLSGWGARQYEWQFGLGIQHELLPRLSVEVTYNRRRTYNQTFADTVGQGCDVYLSPDPDGCLDRLFNFQSDYYDFYGVSAPIDPRLPNGGGYFVPGFVDRKPSVATNTNTNEAVIFTGDRRKDYWRGVDTNVTMRVRGGLRVTAGTSTGSRYDNQCGTLTDSLTNGIAGGVVLLEGRERACEPDRKFQTNVRGTASYTIPWVDVLVSTAFSYRPGIQLVANYEMPLTQLVWLPGSEYRATNTVGCSVSGGGVNPGCLLTNTAATTVTRDLLSNDTYGEGIRLVDLKLAKNIRFAGKRVNFGVDVYNLFNSDGALGYCTNYPTCGTGTANERGWRTVERITTPRFARFQLQFEF